MNLHNLFVYLEDRKTLEDRALGVVKHRPIDCSNIVSVFSDITVISFMCHKKKKLHPIHTQSYSACSQCDKIDVVRNWKDIIPLLYCNKAICSHSCSLG